VPGRTASSAAFRAPHCSSVSIIVPEPRKAWHLGSYTLS
jgi:hypothetical protein